MIKSFTTATTLSTVSPRISVRFIVSSTLTRNSPILLVTSSSPLPIGRISPSSSPTPLDTAFIICTPISRIANAPLKVFFSLSALDTTFFTPSSPTTYICLNLADVLSNTGIILSTPFSSTFQKFLKCNVAFFILAVMSASCFPVTGGNISLNAFFTALTILRIPSNAFLAASIKSVRPPRSFQS